MKHTKDRKGVPDGRDNFWIDAPGSHLRDDRDSGRLSTPRSRPSNAVAQPTERDMTLDKRFLMW